VSKRSKKDTSANLRQRVAEALIVWFDGFSRLDDKLLPSTATWEFYAPLEQMRALKAAEAVLRVFNKGENNV
jgi:hypothetical protein